MNRQFRTRISIILSYALVTVMLALSNCSKPTPSAKEIMTSRLTSGTWVVKTVSVDNVDQTVVYKGLTIKFTSTGFTTTKGGAVWPASGTWSFSAADGSAFIRNDGVAVKAEATDTTLKLTLTWATTTLGGGRFDSVSGLNIFNFTK